MRIDAGADRVCGTGGAGMSGPHFIIAIIALFLATLAGTALWGWAGGMLVAAVLAFLDASIWLSLRQLKD